MTSKYKAAAHYAYKKLEGNIKNNRAEAKVAATEWFLREIGREPSMNENDGLYAAIEQLIIEEDQRAKGVRRLKRCYQNK